MPAVKQVLRLQYVQIGRRLFTTEDWLEEFIDHCTAARIADHQCRSGNRCGRKVARILQLYETEAILRRAGI